MPCATVCDGTKFYYELEGNPSNPVLMFSNSLGTTLNMWDRQSSTFPTTFQLNRYDSRGHGKLIVSKILTAEYVEIANAAHLSNIEQPEQFNAALSDFLERNTL